MDPSSGKNYAYLGAIAFLIIGCLVVLRPFLAAILFAAAVVISSWPMFVFLLGRMNGRRTLAALTLRDEVLPERITAFAQRAGVALLFMLMALAIFNDLSQRL